MIQDAWKNFELSGKISDYLAYKEKCGPEGKMVFPERGMGSYGTEHSSDRDRVKSNADWRLR